MRQNQQSDGILVFIVAAMALIFIGIPAWYAAHAESLHRMLLTLAQTELRLFSPFSDEARTASSYISSLSASEVSWETVTACLTYAGNWMRWPLCLLLCALGVAAWHLGRVGKLHRTFNMESLLQNNAESFPCLRPIVGRGNYLLSFESYDSGPWKIARSPVQFALEHKLLLGESGQPYAPDQVLRNGLGLPESVAFGQAIFDDEGASKVFIEQLGPQFSGVDNLSPVRKALAAAFMLYADGAKHDALALLDSMSASYIEKNDGKELVPSCPVVEQAEFQKRVNKSIEKHRHILDELTSHAAYELPWFMGLLYRARKKGVLACSQFLFLRPLDRPLWYALSQCGGRVAWAEAFAPWAHYTAEERQHKSLSEPAISGAVTGLRAALDAQGWLISTPDNASSHGREADEDRVESGEYEVDLAYAFADDPANAWETMA